MIIRSEQRIDTAMLHNDEISEFMKHVTESTRRQVCDELMNKLHVGKLYTIQALEPRTFDATAESCFPQIVVRQDIMCTEMVQCKNCRMHFPWCCKFKSELNGEGYCPYGQEIEEIEERKAPE